MIDSTTSISDFLSAAAAKQPTPGGGAVAALAGALAAAMAEMVLNYSVAKKDLLQFSESNKAALHELSTARQLLLDLLVEDQAAYQSYSDAKKSGADVGPLIDQCVRVPESIGITALAILQIANRVVGRSNKWLLSDLAVCGELAMATVRCAIHNVRVNLPEVADAMRRAKLSGECDRLQARAVEEIRKLIPAISAIQSAK